MFCCSGITITSFPIGQRIGRAWRQRETRRECFLSSLVFRPTFLFATPCSSRPLSCNSCRCLVLRPCSRRAHIARTALVPPYQRRFCADDREVSKAKNKGKQLAVAHHLAGGATATTGPTPPAIRPSNVGCSQPKAADANTLQCTFAQYKKI